MRYAFVAASLVLTVWTNDALAHAHLVRSEPAANTSSSSASVTEIRLLFSEAIEAALSTVDVTSSQGREMPHRRATASPALGPAGLVVPIDQLQAGLYRVSWTVVSRDTHRTSGSFTFTIEP